MCWNSQCVLTNLVLFCLFFFFSYCVKSDSQVPSLFFMGGGEWGIGRQGLDYFSVSGRVWKLSSCNFGQNTAYAFVHSKTIRLISSFCWWKLSAVGPTWWFHGPLVSMGFGSSLPTCMCGANGFLVLSLLLDSLTSLAQWRSQISLSVILHDIRSIKKHLYSAPVVNISRSASQCIW